MYIKMARVGMKVNCSDKKCYTQSMCMQLIIPSTIPKYRYSQLN